MFERMIVAFDGTDTGLDGLVLSMGLARALGSEVVVVYVYDEELRASSREGARELAEHADAVLAGARDRVSQALAIRFCALSASSPAQGLHELARSEEAELIVLGSRRLGPRTKAALGAVSENVMRAAPCAVAVAPRGYRSEGGFVPQRIGVGWIPTDEGEHALGVAYRIARITGGSVELVTTTSTTGTIESLDTRARRAIDGVVDAQGGEVEVAVRACVGNPAEELVNQSGNMDLVVLGSRGYGPPRTMLFGSVSSQVIPEALCPVMILAAGSQRETGT
jgi:nucleotide-binding universal stress UspA family protein